MFPLNTYVRGVCTIPTTRSVILGPDGGASKLEPRTNGVKETVAPSFIGVPSGKVCTSSLTMTSSAAVGSNIRPAITIGRSTLLSHTSSIGTNRTPSGSPGMSPKASPQRTSCSTSGRFSSLLQSALIRAACVAKTMASLAFVRDCNLLRAESVRREPSYAAVESPIVRPTSTPRMTSDNARARRSLRLHNAPGEAPLIVPSWCFRPSSGKGDGALRGSGASHTCFV